MTLILQLFSLSEDRSSAKKLLQQLDFIHFQTKSVFQEMSLAVMGKIPPVKTNHCIRKKKGGDGEGGEGGEGAREILPN